MMTPNVGGIDKGARLVLAAVLIGGGLGVVGGTAGYIMAGIGVIPLATGLMGWCPVWQVFGFSTACHSCETKDATPAK